MQSWMIGMVCAVVWTGWWPVLPPWPVALLFAGLALAALARPCALSGFASGAACGCALGIVQGTVLLQSRLPEHCVREPLTVVGTVASLPGHRRWLGGGDRQRFEFAVQEILPGRCAGPRKLVLSYYGSEHIHAGQRWRFPVKLKRPWGFANPGSFNMQAWFAQAGIDGVGSIVASGTSVLLPGAGAGSARHHRLRQSISEHIAGLPMPADVSSILRALTVADKDGIDSRLWQLFQQFGLNHLLVISGLHVAMVAGIGYLLGGAYLRVLSPSGPLAGAIPGLAALLVAILYGAMAGFSLPTQRALCMLGCFVLAALAGRKSGAANSLLLAAATVLFLNPLAALGSGFWLSFSAVAALLWVGCWQRGSGAILRALTTQGFMTLVMLPLGALFFGGGSLVAVLANLVMIPLVGLVIVPLALLGVLCFLAGWPLEAQFWQVADWLLEGFLALARAVSDHAGEWIFLQLNATPAEVVLGLLAVALLVLPGGIVPRLLVLVLLAPLLLPGQPDDAAATPRHPGHGAGCGAGTAVLVRAGKRALL
ncbi:MAG: ComEC/Rec2 family competence protein [Halioglobus sp.]